MVEIIRKKNGLLKLSANYQRDNQYSAYNPNYNSSNYNSTSVYSGNPQYKKPYKPKPKIDALKKFKEQLQKKTRVTAFLSYYQNYKPIKDMLLLFSNLYGTEELLKIFDRNLVKIYYFPINKRQGKPALVFKVPGIVKDVKASVLAHTEFWQIMINTFGKKKVKFVPMFKTMEDRAKYEEMISKRKQKKKEFEDFVKLVCKNYRKKVVSKTETTTEETKDN